MTVEQQLNEARRKIDNLRNALLLITFKARDSSMHDLMKVIAIEKIASDAITKSGESK